jgi:TPR repeat protein
VDSDEREAVVWYRKAAAQNDVDAQYYLGWCYEKGCGVAIDKNEAMVWYQQAASQGYAKAEHACERLAAEVGQSFHALRL